MINFTVGPVQSSDVVREIGREQIPYFRTPEFSAIMFENEELIKKFAKADENARAAFITGSGTASMEAVAMNILTTKDKALVVNGGSCGQRFVDLCRIHCLAYEDIKLDPGKPLTDNDLEKYNNKGLTAFLVNIHETSTGVYYDMKLIHKFCQTNQLMLIVDAISSFLADEFDMKALGVDVMITGSQKALACPPGISIILLSPASIKRVWENDSRCMYLDLKDALKNGERGQTPFTPAVGILLQIHARLKEIESMGGAEYEIKRIHTLAEDFRRKIADFPFEIFSDSLSNAVTPLHPFNVSAYDIFITLKDEYGIWICPNGGNLKDKLFRVGHIGELTIDDNDKLIAALKDMQTRGLL